MEDNLGTCKFCGKKVIWVERRGKSGETKHIPFDCEPDPRGSGNYVPTTSHFDTCPHWLEKKCPICHLVNEGLEKITEIELNEPICQKHRTLTEVTVTFAGSSRVISTKPVALYDLKREIRRKKKELQEIQKIKARHEALDAFF
jgi:phage FluMu protein Com